MCEDFYKDIWTGIMKEMVCRLNCGHCYSTIPISRLRAQQFEEKDEPYCDSVRYCEFCEGVACESCDVHTPYDEGGYEFNMQTWLCCECGFHCHGCENYHSIEELRECECCSNRMGSNDPECERLHYDRRPKCDWMVERFQCTGECNSWYPVDQMVCCRNCDGVYEGIWFSVPHCKVCHYDQNPECKGTNTIKNCGHFPCS